MLRISERAAVFPDSPIRKLVPYAEAAKAAGRIVHPLNIGQPDIKTPQPFMDTLHHYGKDIIAYGMSQGEPEFRQAMVGYYNTVDIDVNADDIVITAGGSEAILFAFHIVAEPGDDVLIFEPYYTNYNAYACMSSVHLRPVKTYAANGFHLPSDEEIKAAIGPRTKAMFISTPNNPTGTVLSESEMHRLAAIAREYNLYVISDEVYREFCYDGESHTSVLHIKELEDHAILVDSISKRYSACGARIGALVTRNHVVRDAAIRMAQGRLCPPVIAQAAATAVAKLGMDFFIPLREEYQRRRDVTYEGLMKTPGVTCLLPKGAFYVMAEMPIADCETFAKWLLTDFSHQNETVLVAPGPGFYATGKYETPGNGLNQIRLAYVIAPEKLERAMEILARGVDAFLEATITAHKS
ncbi:MAG TPA: pyridoxal phosphate-dependent aminotransferase [Holophaga sp.]|nr:pyridoxal phosphate-dependent aminotransferase [Holophaga sp.]